MARTVGDLFIRVTAKDSQFKKQMGGVRKSIGQVGSSVGRLTGLFGMAFGAASGLAFVLQGASKYSGVFVQQMSLLKRDILLIQIAMGKAFGPLFAEILEDFRSLIGMTDEGKANLNVMADTIGALYRAIKKILAPVKWLFDLLAKIGGSQFVYDIGTTIRPASAKTQAQARKNRQGMTPEQLKNLQMTSGAGKGKDLWNFSTGLGYGSDGADVKLLARIGDILQRIEQTGTPK